MKPQAAARHPHISAAIKQRAWRNPTITDLTPTGRGGGFVSVSKVSLEEVLRRFDAAYPDFTSLPRAEVVSRYLKTQQEGLRT